MNDTDVNNDNREVEAHLKHELKSDGDVKTVQSVKNDLRAETDNKLKVNTVVFIIRELWA